MKAMIFAAGLGKRLKPYTDSKPKALVEVYKKPMLEWVILRLKQFGISKIIINVHHFSDQIINFLNSKNNFGIHIEISQEDELLDTGGGLKNAFWFFRDEDDILVHNTDILSDIDLNQLYVYHKKNKSDATLCIRSRKTNRFLLFKDDNQLCGWTSKKEKKTLWVNEPQKQYHELSFCGIHIISSSLLKNLSFQKIFPIIPEYLRFARDHKIQGFRSDNFTWLDLGKKENIDSAQSLFAEEYFSNLLI